MYRLETVRKESVKISDASLPYSLPGGLQRQLTRHRFRITFWLMKQVFFLCLFITSSAAAEVLAAAKAMELSHTAPRLKFAIEGGETATCTGFLIKPTTHSECGDVAKKDFRPIFVTAAHCQFDSELKRIHNRFLLTDKKKNFRLENSKASACNDMLVNRAGGLKKHYLSHKVSSEIPRVGDKLTALGYPVSIVGNDPKVGLKLECEYEGVTQTDANAGWQAQLFQHQMVCNFPYYPGQPQSSLGGMSGGPVFNQNGEVIGVISQQRHHCSSYSEDCNKARLMFTELTSEQFNCKGQITPQKTFSRYKYSNYLPWNGRKPVPSIEAEFDHMGCVTKLYRSTESPSFQGDPETHDFRGFVPRL